MFELCKLNGNNIKYVSPFLIIVHSLVAVVTHDNTWAQDAVAYAHLGAPG